MELFDPRAVPLSDNDILSFFRMINAPDQTAWDYDDPDDESPAGEHEEPHSQVELLQRFRDNFLPNPQNFALWAKDKGQVVGMVGINRFEAPSRAHCAELGIGVAAAYQRQGIGNRLATGVIQRARREGIRRLEADCLADNMAVIMLLRKVGFAEEGVRVGAIQKQGTLQDMRFFGLLL